MHSVKADGYSVSIHVAIDELRREVAHLVNAVDELREALEDVTVVRVLQSPARV